MYFMHFSYSRMIIQIIISWDGNAFSLTFPFLYHLLHSMSPCTWILPLIISYKEMLDLWFWFLMLLAVQFGTLMFMDSGTYSCNLQKTPGTHRFDQIQLWENSDCQRLPALFYLVNDPTRWTELQVLTAAVLPLFCTKQWNFLLKLLDVPSFLIW